jgi:hypothetical protein
VAYLKDHYFNQTEYIRTGIGNDPLVCIFGPIKFQTAANWTEIMPSAGEDIEFLTLWYESGEAGANADGEFAWVFQDNIIHITHLDNFYKNKAPQLKTVAGSAYPGFNDFYEEGGSGTGYFTIPSYNGSTLTSTFDKIEQYKANIDMVQLVTFNDFGEGTMFEPTVETGFDYLKRVQVYTGVTYGETELKLVHRLYLLRKQYINDQQIQQQLNQASLHLRNLEISEAAVILNGIQVMGISENKNDSGNLIIVSPNPYTGGGININFGTIKTPAKILISDISGKIVYEKRLENGTSSLSISDLFLSKGFYLITLQDGKFYTTARFVVPE